MHRFERFCLRTLVVAQLGTCDLHPSGEFIERRVISKNGRPGLSDLAGK